jgi:hypothetical protein
LNVLKGGVFPLESDEIARNCGFEPPILRDHARFRPISAAASAVRHTRRTFYEMAGCADNRG